MEITSHKSPQKPRPPSQEIVAVYHDPAKILFESLPDADGQRPMGWDALEQRLNTAGHTLAAVEWAFHVFCEQWYLRASNVKEKQVRAIRPGVSEAKPRTVDVPAIAATEEFWPRYEAGSFSPALWGIAFHRPTTTPQLSSTWGQRNRVGRTAARLICRPRVI
jgi:hypothetical protein